MTSETKPTVGVFVFTEETSSLVPVGQYAVITAAPELVDTEYGQKVRLAWTVTVGEHQGETASTLCGLPKGKLNPSHGLYQFVCAFLGRQPTEGEPIDFNSFVGMPGTVIVSPTQTGKGTKVTAFLPQQQSSQVLSPQPVAQQPAAAYAQPAQPPPPQQSVERF